MKKIKELREQRGLTRDELAQKVGINSSTLFRIETGHTKTKPHKLTLKAIARALGVKVQELEA